jgi:hypothetical protein
MKITLEDQKKCVQREIGMRKRVYPSWTLSGKMHPDKAEYEIAAMEAVLETLQGFKGRAGIELDGRSTI